MAGRLSGAGLASHRFRAVQRRRPRTGNERPSPCRRMPPALEPLPVSGLAARGQPGLSDVDTIRRTSGRAGFAPPRACHCESSGMHTTHTFQTAHAPRGPPDLNPHHTPAGSPRGRIWHVRRLRARNRRHRQGDRPAAACKNPPHKQNRPARRNPPGQTMAGFVSSRAEPFMRAGVIPVPGSQSQGSADHPSCPRRHGGGPTAPAPPRRRHQLPS